MNLRALFLCASAACAAVAAADDQVLVLSAQKQLLHAALSGSASAGFTSAGLAELAMDALGLATGNVVRPAKGNTVALPAIQNPLQADIFQHVDAYALVFVQDDGATLDAIAAGTTFTDASYHNVFPLTHRRGAAQKVPDVIANEFSGALGASGAVKCAGSTAICSGTKLQNTVAVDATRVDKVLAENAFLHKGVAEDARFAQELAQVSELTASLSSSAAGQSFYVVGFSDVQTLESSKRSDASKALAAQVSEFLSALQKTHAASGAQVVASREAAPSSPNQLKAMKQLQDVTSYSRLLASLATPEPADSGSSDDDDDDSGSSDEDDEDDESDANATSSSNSTVAIGKVSMEEIAEYQIVLWTSVLLGVALLMGVLALCNMNTGRDSLLYAKFITDAGHRKGE
ncbi:Rxlr-like protein [Globisporangium polare]